MHSSWFDRLNINQPALPLPAELDQASAFAYLNSIRVENAPDFDLQGYCKRDWRRFLYTWGLVKDLSGRCLELGANPYFTTGLLRQFTQLDVHLANYFGELLPTSGQQKVQWVSMQSGSSDSTILEYSHFNVERDMFPYPDHLFDVVIFCEIIEHLQSDPFFTLKEIKRILKPGGRLILTTPNVAKLDNFFQIAAGKNINDRYSGYGPYGRHNREYTQSEIAALLQTMGFTVESGFTANVHFSHRLVLLRSVLVQLLARAFFPWRRRDLGQYIFVRARNDHPQHGQRPDWLFRSFNPGD